MTQFRNYKKFRSQVLNLFESFLDKKINLSELINFLRDIENTLKDGKDTKKGIWFKFYKDYNLATTINDLDNDIFITDAMKIAINNPLEFKIHFS